jgi:hypothetical protein
MLVDINVLNTATHKAKYVSLFVRKPMDITSNSAFKRFHVKGNCKDFLTPHNSSFISIANVYIVSINVVTKLYVKY